ncbi:MAG: hypothetical protein AVDCRST_MAG03-1655, partial [uncultured Rubrobacteraceae bacterium]
ARVPAGRPGGVVHPGFEARGQRRAGEPSREERTIRAQV